MLSRPVRSWSKPAPSVSRLEIVAADVDRALDGVMIPASTWSSVLLPAPLGPMTASDSPWTSRNETSRSAQNSVGPVVAPEQLRERVAERRLLREPEAVADAEVADVDDVRRRQARPSGACLSSARPAGVPDTAAIAVRLTGPSRTPARAA